jgi:hypothetical protein
MINKIVERMVTDGSTGGDARRSSTTAGPLAGHLLLAASTWTAQRGGGAHRPARYRRHVLVTVVGFFSLS